MKIHEKKYLSLLGKSLPETPGIYQFFDSNNKIIYVGKAKNLRKRVSSYFSKEKPGNDKINSLVKKISDIKHIIVDTESDALLLENNLIKEKNSANLRELSVSAF